MEDMDILQYFNENASKEDWKLVQQVYAYELDSDLKEFGMEGKETFTLAELSVIYTRACLEKDLDGWQERLQGMSVGDNKETFKEFIDGMELRYNHIVELNGGNVE